MTIQETYEDLRKTFSERTSEKEKYEVQLRTDSYRVLHIKSNTYDKQFQYNIEQLPDNELQSFVMTVCEIILRSMFVVSYCIKIIKETPQDMVFEIEIL